MKGVVKVGVGRVLKDEVEGGAWKRDRESKGSRRKITTGYYLVTQLKAWQGVRKQNCTP